MSEELREGNMVRLSFLDGSFPNIVQLNRNQLVGIWKGDFQYDPLHITSELLVDIGFHIDLDEIDDSIDYILKKGRREIIVRWDDNFKWILLLRFDIGLPYHMVADHLTHIHEVQNLVYYLTE